MSNHTYGQLPTIVSHDNRVSDFQCRLYTEISSLSNKYGYCFASNEYLGKTFSKSPETISRAISGLQKLGYLTVIIEDGYKRKMKVKMDFSDMEPVDENVKGGSQKDQGGLTKMSRGVDENVKTANNIIQLDKFNEINRRIVETSSTVTLIDEVDETSVEIHHVPEYFNEEQKTKRKKVAPKKEKVIDDPAPITPMWQEYEKRFADLNGGEKPVFHKKYLRSLKTLFAVLRDRSIKKGIVPLNDVQPWCDFLDMAAQHLKNNPKETYLRGRFDPLGIEAEFNKWITTLNNRPKTDTEKWMDFARRNGVV